MPYRYKLGWQHSNEVRIKFTLLLTEGGKAMSHILKINFFFITILDSYRYLTYMINIKALASERYSSWKVYIYLHSLWGNYSFYLLHNAEKKKHYVVNIIYLVTWMLSADWLNDSNVSFFLLRLKFNLGSQRSLTILVNQHLTPKQTA